MPSERTSQSTAQRENELSIYEKLTIELEREKQERLLKRIRLENDKDGTDIRTEDPPGPKIGDKKESSDEIQSTSKDEDESKANSTENKYFDNDKTDEECSFSPKKGGSSTPRKLQERALSDLGDDIELARETLSELDGKILKKREVLEELKTRITIIRREVNLLRVGGRQEIISYLMRILQEMQSGEEKVEAEMKKEGAKASNFGKESK